MHQSIAFSQAAADGLIRATEDAENRLRNQGGERSTAATIALTDFAGGYARAFALACETEAHDRGLLVGRLGLLADTVRRAKQQAEAEQERLEEVAAWQQAVDSGGGVSQSPLMTVFPPRPAAGQIMPLMLTIGFTAQQRVRTAISGDTSVSSAAPDNLRSYAQLSQTSNRIMEEEYSSLESALEAYRSSCSWAPIDANVLSGFRQLIDENLADVQWLEEIAQAFEDADSATLSDVHITVVLHAGEHQQLLSLLQHDQLTPAQVSEAWQTFVAHGDREEVEQFVHKYSFEIANLSGVPFEVQNYAARYALRWALPSESNSQDAKGLRDERLPAAYTRMGFEEGDMTLAEFETELQSVKDALTRAESLTAEGADVQLVSFGSHHGAMTAGISFGNLDTASHVGLLVSGMNSDVHSLPNTFDSLSDMHAQGSDTAMVTWIGYNSPSALTVAHQHHADHGAEQLAPFLEGIEAQRTDTNQLERFVVLSHSYGTNVAAEALQLTTAEVDVFVSLASAGLKHGTTADDLDVDEIYATESLHDIWAPIGRHIGFDSPLDQDDFSLERELRRTLHPTNPRVDPRDLDGATVLPAGPTDGAEGVTSHSLSENDPDHDEDDEPQTEFGYLDPETSVSHGVQEIMKGPYEVDRNWLESIVDRW